MPSLKDLKNRIGSVKNTRKITKAMQMVAAAKLRRAQEAAEAARPALADNLPAVRQLAPRTLQVNGMYRHGWMIAPALHDVVLQVLDGGASPLAQQFDLAMELLK